LCGLKRVVKLSEEVLASFLLARRYVSFSFILLIEGRNKEYLKAVVEHALAVGASVLFLPFIPDFLKPFVCLLMELTVVLGSDFSPNSAMLKKRRSIA
jgi:hypothetical protein